MNKYIVPKYHKSLCPNGDITIQVFKRANAEELQALCDRYGYTMDESGRGWGAEVIEVWVRSLNLKRWKDYQSLWSLAIRKARRDLRQ